MNVMTIAPRSGDVLPLVRRAASTAGGADGSAPIWLVSFADLIGVLLAFFVLIFSMSHLDPQRLEQMAGHVDLGREPIPGATGATAAVEQNAPQAEVELGEDLGYLGALLREQVNREKLLAATIVRRQGARIVLSLPADLLFEPNGAHPTRDGDRALFALVGILRNLPNRIEVEGHADPHAPDQTAFASNWELSLSRALTVAELLERSGYRLPVVARGRGDSGFDEISTALPPARREALARRVDIIVHEEAS
jgi:chemotaxis protein MotB